MKWPIVLVVAALAAPAAAASRKILVLPVEGSVDAPTRVQLTSEIARLARALGGQVATGTATFADTALAVGCAPRAPRCSEDVIATLGVDELIWGIATRESGQTRLVVRRAVRGATMREAQTTFSGSDAGGRVSAAIATLFAQPGAEAELATHPSVPGDAEPGAAALAPGAPPLAAPAEGTASDDHRDRTLGIALTAGGGAAVVLGLALWVSYAGLQGDIDRHPVRTVEDFRDLRALEDRASARAVAGDVLVIAGLVAGGIGGYYLYRDHRRRAIAAVPALASHGAGLTIAIVGDLP